MCGRYTLAADADELVEAFDVPLPAFDLVPRYNIAPGQDAPVVARDRRGRRAGLLRWGFVPGWRERADRPLVNARAQRVAVAPSFRDAFRRRRCLVPADGFYEWRREPGARVPYWLHPGSGGLLSFAAIWEGWAGKEAEARHAFAIITVPANEDVAPIHDRMPAIVFPQDRSRWLSRDANASELEALLRPAPAGTLTARRVSRRVNRPSEDDAGLIDAV